MKKAKRAKRRKVKFVQSLLNPGEHAEPPLLIKQRVPLYEQFSLPAFRKSEFGWMNLFKSKPEENIMLRRTLISTNGEMVKSGGSEAKKNELGKEKQSVKGHLKTCSGFGVIFEPKAVQAPLKTPVMIKSASTSRSLFFGNQPSVYVKRSFDSSVIPEKTSNLVTLKDVLRYFEYINRPLFK